MRGYKPMVNYVKRQPPQNVQALPGIQEPISVRQWQGLNTYDPYSINETQFTEMSNMTTDDFPAVSVRPGFSVLGSTSGKVLGLMVWKGTQLHAVFNTGDWKRWNGSSWDTLASGLNTTARWSWTNYQGNLDDINLVASNGVDPVKRYDGSTVQSLTGAPSGGNFITTYSNRLWLGVGKELHACALDQPEQWSLFEGTDEDSFAIDLESTAGENINMLSGSLSRLTIGMPSSVHLLFGNVPSDFNTHKITEDEGISNNAAVVTQEGTMRFMHTNGIYEYAASANPDKAFSEIVKTFYSGISTDSTAGTDGEKLYFTLGTGRTLVYDNQITAWSAWDISRPEQYALIGNQLYIGDSTGRVLKLGDGTTDAGTPINWYMVTKPFTNLVMSQRQRWLKLWLYAEIPTGTTVNVFLSKTKDGNDFELVHTMTGTGAKVERIIIPVRSVVLENTVRVKISGAGPAKIHELVRQVRQLPLF